MDNQNVTTNREREITLRPIASGSTELEIPVYNERVAITSQPVPTNENIFPGNRRPIPVSTIEWQSTNMTQIVARNGLDFLDGVDGLYIQQTIELDDLLLNVESENRYTVKVPRGESLYLATESSTSCHRTWFGSNRAFSMRLYDHTRQESLQFRRKFACISCMFGCYLQEMEVWLPPGDFLGVIQQQWSLLNPTLFVLTPQGDTILFRIIGPASMCVCTISKDVEFKVLTGDGTQTIGSISHQWDHLLVGYNMCVEFPNRSMDKKHKALLLGAAFLLEYMYFERQKSSKCCKCAC